MKRILLMSLVLMAFAFTSEAWAQRTISGQVTSAEDGEGIPGVSVRARGTSTGVTTDFEGNYRLSVPEGVDELEFSFVGYETVVQEIGNRSTIDVQLQEDVQQLQEVVVVGYGTQDRRELTSSISSIQGEAIENLVTPSFENQLAGRAAGVQITTPSGLIGESPVIRIRGINSISQSADPLIVIDGVPVVTTSQSGIANVNPLANINPSDIESFQVLKDGSATAIYGSRAANGVIIITTKRGKSGAAQINLTTSFGFNETAGRFDLLNGDQFVEIANEKRTNAGQTATAVQDVNTDWQDYIFRRGFVQNHNLSVSGGSEATQYFFSVGLSEQQGAIRANELTRYSFRANVDHEIGKAFRIGTSLNYSNTTTYALNNGENSLSGAVLASTRMLPNVPIHDPDNDEFDGFNVSTGGLALGSGANQQGIDNNYPNIAFVLANNTYRTNQGRVLGNAYAELDLLQGLTARTQIGIDLLNSDDFLSWDPRHGDGRGYNGYVWQSYRPTTRWNWQNTLNYNLTLGSDHDVDFTIGYEAQRTDMRGYTAEGRDFADRYLMQQGLIGGSYSVQLSSGFYNLQGFDSYFGRLNYGFRGKYLVSLSVRNDGISSLPAENRRGTFPGVSIGWRISDEDFWTFDAINDLKIRGSYAEVGNTEIGFFPYAGLYGPVLYGSNAGIAFTNVANPNLQWESSTKYNIGLDIGLLGDAVGITLDLFQNDVDNLVLSAPVAQSIGVPGNTISQNIGSMVNRGIEFSIQTNIIETDNFTWGTNFNFTYLTNEVTRLNDPITTTFNRTEEGSPIGMLYGVEWAGVNPQNGNAMYYRYDQESGEPYIVQFNPEDQGWYLFNEDNPGDLTTASNGPGGGDLRSLGNTIPKWLGGWTNNFRFGNFDAEIFLRYSGGNYIMNETRRGMLGQGFANNSTEILDRWTTAGQETDVPRLYTGRDAAMWQTSVANSRFVEKGDFLRVQNIVLGYRIPGATLENFLGGGISSIRAFAQVQNPFIITGYTGLDPELNRNSSPLSFGIDYNSAPIVRTYSFGLTVGF